jgi:hypothetical protein
MSDNEGTRWAYLTSAGKDDLDRLANDVDALNIDLPELLDDVAANQPLLCEFLYALREQRIRLAELEATVEAKAARSMGPADRIEWDGYYAERKGGMVRKHWNHGLLAAKVLQQTCTDPETSEIDVANEEAAQDVVSELLRAAAISYWRTTVLRSMGIDYDGAVETERGRRTVHVTKGSAA